MVARLQGTDPDTADRIVIEVIGDGIGRSGDPYPSFGMVNVAFSLAGNDHGKQPRLTQGKFGSVYPSFQPNRSPKQSDSSLLYQQYQMPEALKLFADIRSGNVAVKLSPDFGRTILEYRIELPVDSVLNRVISDFNRCTATTNLYPGRFHITGK